MINFPTAKRREALLNARRLAEHKLASARGELLHAERTVALCQQAPRLITEARAAIVSRLSVPQFSAFASIEDAVDHDTRRDAQELRAIAQLESDIVEIAAHWKRHAKELSP